MIFWLEKAKSVAENEQQARVLGLLIEFYRTGDLKKFDEYNIEWVKDINIQNKIVLEPFAGENSLIKFCFKKFTIFLI